MYLFIYYSFKDDVINRDNIALNNLIIFKNKFKTTKLPAM